MGEDSVGTGPPAQSGPSVSDKLCQTAGCNNPVQVLGRGNHHYCLDCKQARSSPAASKPKNKRGPSSPLEQAQSKLSKEDEFAFDFNTAFGCDLDEFLVLDKCSIVAKFETLFSNARESAENARCEQLRLAAQLTSLREKLNTAKLALADKALHLYELSRQPIADKADNQNHPSSSLPSSGVSPISNKAEAPAKPPPTANPKKSKPVDNRPTLVAWLNKGVLTSSISVDNFDSLLNINSDGPIVQQLKKSDDKVTLTFRDATARDKAKEIISLNLDSDAKKSIFHSVTVPQKTYPAIARLNGLVAIQSLSNDDKQIEKQARCAAIKKLILDENPSLQGQLLSVRILSNRPDTSSFHVRLGLFSKISCDQLIEKGRILIDKRSHAVVAADPAKEIRQCLRCQKYGHLIRFCKAVAATCAKCAGPHETSTCDASPKDYKCSNCSKNHSAGSRTCPVQVKAISQYENYISS